MMDVGDGIEPLTHPGPSTVPAQSRPGEAEEFRLSREVLTSSSDTDVQEIVTLLQQICQVQHAAVSILADARFHYLVTAGIAPLSCDASDSMCQQMMSVEHLVVVPDTSQDARFASSPYVDGSRMSLRFYASAPLYAPNGTMVGRLCLFDSAVKHLTPLQEQSLTTLAASITSILNLRLTQRDLALNPPHPEPELDRVLSIAAQVSHDLRSPLTALSTSLSMLKESTPHGEDPIRLHLLDSAGRAVKRMTGLVEGLLRLHNVTASMNPTAVDLGESAIQAMHDLRPNIESAGGSVKIRDLPIVTADLDQMYSVFLNLIANALKFARPDVPAIVEIGCGTHRGTERIYVRDNGAGIPHEDRQRVFAMFSRLTTAPGHGIGLATVARVIEAHGGRFGIEDAPDGQGTEIWFELPMTEAG